MEQHAVKAFPAAFPAATPRLRRMRFRSKYSREANKRRCQLAPLSTSREHPGHGRHSTIILVAALNPAHSYYRCMSLKPECRPEQIKGRANRRKFRLLEASMVGVPVFLLAVHLARGSFRIVRPFVQSCGNRLAPPAILFRHARDRPPYL